MIWAPAARTIPGAVSDEKSSALPAPAVEPSVMGMNRAPLPLRRVAAAILGFVVVEWLLLELLRAPYRPPYDMTTFLGVEKYAVVAIMACLGIAGLGELTWLAVRSSWSRRQMIVVTLLLAGWTGTGAWLVVRPLWPVTPWEWVLS